jgi:hypothetical protein
MTAACNRSMFRRLAFLSAALFPLCALAAEPAAAPAGRLTEWLTRNTDLAVQQVVIAGPQNVYTLEPLGPRAVSGELMALVRTESLSPDWRAAHGFRSWDANMVFDCAGRRMRVVRSAAYPEPNRSGRASVEAPDPAWFAPKPGEPAARLFAAACDESFVWPLRAEAADPGAAREPAAAPASATPAAPAAAEVQARAQPAGPQASSPPTAQTAAEAQPAATATAPAVARRFAVQLARGPIEDGAKRALVKARAALGPAADGLVDVTEESHVGRRRRYTALLTGFSDADSAAAACAVLVKAGQACLTRAMKAD